MRQIPIIHKRHRWTCASGINRVECRVGPIAERRVNNACFLDAQYRPLAPTEAKLLLAA